jgi:hypothetical protein
MLEVVTPKAANAIMVSILRFTKRMPKVSKAGKKTSTMALSEISRENARISRRGTTKPEEKRADAA